MSSRAILIVALGVAASAFTATTAQGQLGKLTKKATNAAANAAGVPTGNARMVKKIDLTSQQLAQINTGMAASIKAGPDIIKKWEKQQQEYDRAMGEYSKKYDEYSKKKEKYDACVDAEKEKGQKKMDAVNKKTDAAGEQMKAGMPDTAVMMAQAQKAKAAAERVQNGTATAADRQTLADYQKMMAGMQGGSAQMMAAMQEAQGVQTEVADSIKKKCGGEPVEPTKPGAAGAGGAGAAPTSAADEINKEGAKAAGMSDSEYQQLKEKAMGYASSNTQVQGGDGTPDDEAKAINSALAQTRDLMAQAGKANVPLM